MFGQLKNLFLLKSIQKELASQKEIVEKQGIKVTINGKLEVEEITINPDLEKREQEKILKDCLNEAQKKIQFKILNKLKETR